jgi:hypothetical protein
LYEGGPLAPSRGYRRAPVEAGVRTRIQAIVVATTFALLWGELFFTADADEPNTWAGAITNTAILAAASVLALALVRSRRTEAEDAGMNAKAALIALGGALFGLLLFWTGAGVVLGVAVFLLAWPFFRPLAYTGATIAVANASYFPIDTMLEFAPGLPG